MMKLKQYFNLVTFIFAWLYCIDIAAQTFANIEVRLINIENVNVQCGEGGDNIPEPSWNISVGYDGGNFSADLFQNLEVIGCQSVAIIGGIQVAEFTNVCANVLSFDIEFWEDDGCGSIMTFDPQCGQSDDDHDVYSEAFDFDNFAAGTTTYVLNRVFQGDVTNDAEYNLTFEVIWSGIPIIVNPPPNVIYSTTTNYVLSATPEGGIWSIDNGGTIDPITGVFDPSSLILGANYNVGYSVCNSTTTQQITIQTPSNSCIRPDALACSNPTNNTVDLDWSIQGNPGGFLIEYKAPDFPSFITAPTSHPWINEVISRSSNTSEEGFEIAGAVGMDLSCYKVQGYNVSGNATFVSSPNTTITSSGSKNGFGVYSESRNLPAKIGLALIYDSSSCDCFGTTEVVHFINLSINSDTLMVAKDGLAAGETSDQFVGGFSGLTSNSLQMIDINGEMGATFSEFQWVGPTTASLGNVNVSQNIVSKARPFSGSTDNVTVPFLNPCTLYNFRIRSSCFNGQISNNTTHAGIKCSSTTTNPISAGSIVGAGLPSVIQICQGDPAAYSFGFTPNDMGYGCLNSKYFISNSAGSIVSGPQDNPVFDYSQLADGAYEIYGVSYYGEFTDSSSLSGLSSTMGCVSLASNPIPINVYDTPVFNNLMATSPSTCGGSDGEIVVNATGSATAGGFVCRIVGGTTWQSSTTFSGLSAGSYTIRIRNVGDGSQICPYPEMSVTVFDPPAPTVSLDVVTNVSCNGGNDGGVNINTSGNNNYLWDDSSGTTNEDLSNVPAGNYSVLVTDQTTGCTVTSMPFMVNEPIVLTSSSSLISNAICSGNANGSASASATGGAPPYTYLWLGSNETTQTAVSLPSGSQTVNITDANGCSSMSIVTVGGPDMLIGSVSQDSPVSCFGGNDGVAILTTSGGNGNNTFLWDNGETTNNPTNLSEGIHTVTITDIMGCTAMASVNISQPIAPLSSTNSSEPTSCFQGMDGTATITVNDGTAPYTYSWQNGQTGSTANNLVAGSYMVTITDANGCVLVPNPIAVGQPAALIAGAIQDVPVICNGESNGKATVTVNGGTAGYTYLWDNGENTAQASQLGEGLHSVSIEDANGCTTVAMVTVSEPTSVFASSSTPSPVSCFGYSDGAATITVSGGAGNYSVIWDDGTSDFNNSTLTAGAHSATVTDDNGCSFELFSIQVNGPGPFVASALSNDVVCFGDTNGSAMVSSTGGNGNNSIIWDAAAGNQTTTTATDLGAGTYSVSIVDGNGCVAPTSVTVNEPDAIEVNFITPPSESCLGNTETISTMTPTGGSNTGFTYVWSTGETSETISFPVNNATNTYSVVVSDSNACTGSDSGSIAGVARPMISAISEISLNESDELSLSLDQYAADNVSYDWNRTFLSGNCSTDNSSTGQTDDTLTDAFTLSNSNTTGQATYEVTPYIEVNGEECPGTATTFEVVVLPSGETATFFVPDVFIKSVDPNGWDIKVTDNDSSVETFTLQVFNRSGAKVHEGNLATSWDGADVQDGVYYYVIKDGSAKLKTGAVLIQQ